MSTVEWGRGIVGLISSAVLALAMSGPALAEGQATEPAVGIAERLVLLQASVADHKLGKDSDGLKDDVKLIVVLHGDASRDAKVRKECVRLLGKLSKMRRGCPTVIVAAIEGLGQTKDPDAATYITAKLRRLPKRGAAPTPVKAAVAAAASICEDEFIEPLLKIVTDSKDYTLAAKAVQALGHFRDCKRKRVKILKTLVETIAKDKPGVKGRSKDPVDGDQYRHTGDLARSRWAALSRVLPGALLQLTGSEAMKGATADWWIDYVRENKRKLGSLFVDEE